MNAPLHQILAELRAGLEAIYGPRLRRIMLFGSQARGDARPDSDIDVMIVIDGPIDSWAETRRTSGLIADVSLRHDTLVSAIFADPVTAASNGQPLYRNVRAEGVPI